MRYCGGKFRVAKDIAKIILSYKTHKEQIIYEPFCGGCWITDKLDGHTVIASDANPYVIAMWQALQRGWLPPEECSKELYVAIKVCPSDYPPELVGFLGTACSFGGKWFDSFAGISYAAISYRTVLRQIKTMQHVSFTCADYSKYSPVGAIIYCDPPYNGLTQPYYTKRFDSQAFYAWCEDQSVRNTVLVSESSAPAHWGLVYTKALKSSLSISQRGSPSIENLYIVKKV